MKKESKHARRQEAAGVDFFISAYSSSVIPNTFCEEFHILVIEENLYIAHIIPYSLNQKLYATEATLSQVSK